MFTKLKQNLTRLVNTSKDRVNEAYSLVEEETEWFLKNRYHNYINLGRYTHEQSLQEAALARREEQFTDEEYNLAFLKYWFRHPLKITVAYIR